MSCLNNLSDDWHVLYFISLPNFDLTSSCTLGPCCVHAAGLQCIASLHLCHSVHHSQVTASSLPRQVAWHNFNVYWKGCVWDIEWPLWLLVCSGIWVRVSTDNFVLSGTVYSFKGDINRSIIFRDSHGTERTHCHTLGWGALEVGCERQKWYFCNVSQLECYKFKSVIFEVNFGSYLWVSTLYIFCHL